MSPIVRRIVLIAIAGAVFLAPATLAHSLWSTTATATLTVTVPAAPVAVAAPTGVTCAFPANPNNEKLVELSWSPVAGATGYRVHHRTGPDSAYKLVTSTTATTSGRLNRNGTFKQDAQPTVAITAVNASGIESAFSAPVTIFFDEGRCS